METIKITPPEGFEIDKEKSTFEEIVFKPIVKKLPKRWEDLGELNGYFVNSSNCSIVPMEPIYNNRAIRSNKNVFATEAQAKASLALAQLSQLREVYQDGWVPNWLDPTSHKYVISYTKHELFEVDSAFCYPKFLAFQSMEIAKEFLENFRDLIEEASPLLFG